MKAVIVEIRGNTAVLLSDDGCIVKVKNQNYELGQEVKMSMKKQFNFKKLASFAAAACLVLLISGGVAAYYTPTTYVSLDVNPSIEYAVNMFDRVLSATGVNDDGSEIIDEIELDNLKHKNIQNAISSTVDEIARKGYLDADGAGIVISTSGDDMEKAQELAENLEETANESCEQNNCKASINAEAIGKKRVEQARELGVTPGKLNLVEKLKASADDPESIDINEWLNKSVKDIMAQTKQNREQARNKGEEKQNREQNPKEDDSDSETNEGFDANKGSNGKANNGNDNSNKGSNGKANNGKNDSDKDCNNEGNQGSDNKKSMGCQSASNHGVKARDGSCSTTA